MVESDLRGLVAAFVTSLLATRAIEAVARRKGLYARTTSRGAHRQPTPRLGGAAIALGIFAAIAFATESLTGSVAVFIGGAAALLVAGVLDDLWSLPVPPRSIAQLAVAAVTAVVLAPEFTLTLPGVDVLVAGWLAVAIVTVWLTAMVNVFNFMDGIDGIAAGTAVATMPAALIMGGPTASALGIGLVGACLGFLIWNHHPASIFMGDGGSQLLGYAVATCFIIDPAGSVAATPVLLALAPFLIDVSATLVRRMLRGENLFTAHDDHLYQRLVRGGLSQRAVVAGYAALALVAGWIAVTYGAAPVWLQGLVIAVCAIAWALVAGGVVERRERGASA